MMSDQITYVSEGALVDSLAIAICVVDDKGQDSPHRSTIETFVAKAIELGWLSDVQIEPVGVVRYAASAVVFLEAAYRLMSLGVDYDFIPLYLAEPKAVDMALCALHAAFEEGIEVAAQELKKSTVEAVSP